MNLSPQRRIELLDALRRGTVPRSLGAFAVGLDRFGGAIDDELATAARGSGKTFTTRWVAERGLGAVGRSAPAFALALRGYRAATAAGDRPAADGLLAWLAGQPNIAAGVKRAAGIKADLDHYGALSFLQGLLVVLRDSGHAGLLVVLDEVETVQRVRGDVRERWLNALRQLVDEIDAGRFPGLYLLITGTPAFFDGPQGVQRLPPLASRLATDFDTDARFDNPRAVQLRLTGFDLERLGELGRRVRDIYVEGSSAAERTGRLVDDAYIDTLARALTGALRPLRLPIAGIAQQPRTSPHPTLRLRRPAGGSVARRRRRRRASGDPA